MPRYVSLVTALVIAGIASDVATTQGFAAQDAPWTSVVESPPACAPPGLMGAPGLLLRYSIPMSSPPLPVRCFMACMLIV